MSLKKIALFVSIIILCSSSFVAAQQDTVDKLKPYINTVSEDKESMSIWQMLEAGGIVMIVLGLLSIFATTTIVYNFGSITPEKIVPKKFCNELIEALETNNYRKSEMMCRDGSNILSRVF